MQFLRVGDKRADKKRTFVSMMEWLHFNQSIKIDDDDKSESTLVQ